MKIHEHQAKALLREFAVPVPRGDVATTPAEAKAVAARLGGRVVVKAQVHAGGRGKAGGIQLADGPVAAEAAARQILGMRLTTPQTPPEGILVRSVLVEEASAVARELYLSVTLDRVRATHVAMASQAGGMEIEEVADRSPEKILRNGRTPRSASRITRRAASPSASGSWERSSSRAPASSGTSSRSISP